MKFNEDLPVRAFLQPASLPHPLQWTDTQVIVPLALSVVFLALFLVVECVIAPEPVLPPCLLREKVPVLVGLSNYFVSVCNFSVMYFIPLWFQTVSLDSASIAGTLWL
jgi:hypothetical protein